MSKDKPMPRMPIYELCAQSASLKTGDGLRLMDAKTLPDHDADPQAIAIHLSNQTRDLHVLTLAAKGDGSEKDILKIGPITNDSKHPLQIMVPTSIKVLTIGSMYGSQDDKATVEIYVDTDSQDNRLKLILCGIPDNREGSQLKSNDYSAFTVLSDPSARCHVYTKPYHGEAIASHHYKYNGEIIDINVAGDIHPNDDTLGHILRFTD